MHIYKAGMGLLTICLIALAAMGCERIIGLDDLEVEDEIEGEGDTCNVVLFGMANMEGKCVHKDAPSENCPGGTYPNDESGDCPNKDNLKCCIKEDQCEKYFSVGLWCDEQGCAPLDGWKMGCPDGQWCCGDMSILD
jgi:hypothetical protein